MHILIAIAGVILVLVTLGDTLETIVLPRGVVRGLRITRLFYRVSWATWLRFVRNRSTRESLLGLFGPLSLLVLLGIWAFWLLVGFAMIDWGLGISLHGMSAGVGFWRYLYVSGTTFFTLGLGDVIPTGGIGRFMLVVEAGVGFGFLALVIGYLPVLYQAFSRREVAISMLDARAGSPPSAVELLCRYQRGGDMQALEALLRDWEEWAADLLESHISFPVLSYYRSQHERQSWITSMTALLDTCSLVLVGFEGAPGWQARMTFAMARHTIVDLCLIFNAPPVDPDPDRLTPEIRAKMEAALTDAGIQLRSDAPPEALDELRALYEPFVNALGRYLSFDMPGWLPDPDLPDNWETTAWDREGHF